MAITLLINAVDMTSAVKLDSASFNQPVRGQRGTSRFTLLSLPTAAFYTPVEGQSVVWKDGSAIVFQGTIDTFEATPMVPSGGGYEYAVTAVSLEQRFDKRFVTRAWPAGTDCGDIVTSIMATELADEGISVGNISAGETLAIAKVYDHARISDVFTELASLCQNFTWYIDPSNGNLYFQARTTTAAPFTVLNANVLALTGPNVNTSRSEYRNRQHVKISETNLIPEVQTFAGNGTTTSFTLNKSIRDIVSIRITTASSSIAVGTFASVPSDGDTILIGGWQYMFVQTMPPPNNASYFTQAINFVLIGRGSFPTLLADTLANLVACILNSGDGFGYYYSSTSIKNQVVADATTNGVDTITLTSNPGTDAAGGMALNSYTAAFSWAAPTSADDGSSSEQSFIERAESTTGAADYQWIYDVGGTTVEQAAGQTPPQSGETLVIEYKPIGFGVVTVDDPAEQAIRAAAEPGSGIYENLAIREDLLTLDAGIAAATALLEANGSMTVRVTFDTDTTGLLPGQYVAINDTALNINASYLVQSVTGKIVPAASGHYWRYRVVAVSGTQTTIEGWAALANKGTPGGVGSGSGSSKRSPQRVAAAKSSDLGFWEANFGLDDDTVGTHPIEKYVPIKSEGVAYTGYVTVNRLAEQGNVETILDVLFSDDYGETWTSIFPSGNQFKIVIPAEASGTDQDSNFLSNKRVYEITTFSEINLKKGWILRLDVLQGGGATGIEVYLRGKPSGRRGQQLNYGLPGTSLIAVMP